MLGHKKHSVNTFLKLTFVELFNLVKDKNNTFFISFKNKYRSNNDYVPSSFLDTEELNENDNFPIFKELKTHDKQTKTFKW